MLDGKIQEHIESLLLMRLAEKKDGQIIFTQKGREQVFEELGGDQEIEDWAFDLTPEEVAQIREPDKLLFDELLDLSKKGLLDITVDDAGEFLFVPTKSFEEAKERLLHEK
jgi:hypothetical protein